ncbi:MAG: sn-glycerol-3-phosphate ABC transporter ATP-binding protein UgpC [Candidatus Krumholzibacteria bacterium]|nr:sn-glycerol-3-phosphate ABC transporter ATP-binding protein UgpC [Candidatus Krumholzibacteria bacterium]
MARVEFKDVEKIYPGNVTAATDINLVIEDEELLVLVGPSGCGKSTVLRMVAGLEEATSGRIFFDGEDVTDRPPKERNIAMVFQNYALYPHMNVFDNMAFGLKLRRHPKAEIEERVGEAARILGIAHLLERKPKALSGGQRQRVALGRAIVRKPSVFLFDEPLSNLDAKMRVQMRTEIRKLNLEIRTTMMYVTHDQVEAMTLGDRLAVMNEGRILQVGTPMELYDRPLDRFVGAFIGSPAMNFVEGAVQGSPPRFESSMTSFPVPPRFGKRSLPAGRAITLGVRPEDLYLKPPEGDGGRFQAVEAVIDVAETLGNEIIFHIDCAGQRIVAREDPGAQGKHGDKVRLFVDLERVHFFDGSSGRALGRE